MEESVSISWDESNFLNKSHGYRLQCQFFESFSEVYTLSSIRWVSFEYHLRSEAKSQQVPSALHKPSHVGSLVDPDSLKRVTLGVGSLMSGFLSVQGLAAT